MRAVELGEAHMPLAQRCAALGVSPQGYFAYRVRQRTPSARSAEDAALAPYIKAAHKTGRQTYGTPRLKIQLAKSGLHLSRRRIKRIRNSLGLAVRTARKWTQTTDSRHDNPIAPNLLQRNFVASAPNSVWVSDITYIRAGGSWLYLCTIIDCFSGAIVGRKISPAIDTNLIQDALAMAIRNRRPSNGCMFHSDRGVQYASRAFRETLLKQGFCQSMSRRANCWDNAAAESCFSRLKADLGDTFSNAQEAQRIVYEYIDVFYNFIRIHSRHNMAPFEFENLALLAA